MICLHPCQKYYFSSYFSILNSKYAKRRVILWHRCISRGNDTWTIKLNSNVIVDLLNFSFILTYSGGEIATFSGIPKDRTGRFHNTEDLVHANYFNCKKEDVDFSNCWISIYLLHLAFGDLCNDHDFSPYSKSKPKATSKHQKSSAVEINSSLPQSPLGSSAGSTPVEVNALVIEDDVDAMKEWMI